MKFAMIMGLMTLTFSAFAQNSTDIQIQTRAESIYKKVVEQRQHQNLNGNDKEDLLNHLKDAARILALQTQNPGPQNPGPQNPGPQNPGPQNPGPQNPYPGQGGQYTPGNAVQAYSDDSCMNLITPVTNRDNCNMLTNVYQSRNVWSVRVNNTCYNTVDRSFAQSCQQLQTLANEPVITNTVADLYADDSCTNKLISLDPSVNYEAWMPVLSGKNVWSVKVENKCLNIADVAFSAPLATKYVNASLTMRGRIDPRAEVIELYSDDSCSNRLTDVKRGDSCPALQTFYGGFNVWSIKYRGRCENIADMNFTNACNTYAQ